MAELMPADQQALLGDVTLLQLAAWVALVVGVFAGLYKAWPWIRRAVRTIDALGELPELVERVRHQVENDHDTNLRDEVTQLLDMTSDMGEQLAGVVDWQEKHEKKSDAAYARITALEQKEKP